MSPGGSKSLPPEEKLLQLIRGRSKPPVPHQADGGRPAASGAVNRFPVPWKLPAWWVTAVNIGLGVVVAGELIAWLLMVARPVPGVPAAPAAPSGSVLSSAASAPASPEPSAPIPALAAAASRPLFDVADRPVTPAGSPASSAQAREVAARLSLIGVVAGDPAQAIIEDTQTKKSYIASVGQALMGGLVVERIQPGRVVLDLHGEKIELSL